MNKDKGLNDALRKKNLSIIKSVKKHLDVPKQYKDLYYIPPYEKGMLLYALNRVKELYFDSSVDMADVNWGIKNCVDNVYNDFKQRMEESDGNSIDPSENDNARLWNKLNRN